MTIICILVFYRNGYESKKHYGRLVATLIWSIQFYSWRYVYGDFPVVSALDSLIYATFLIFTEVNTVSQER